MKKIRKKARKLMKGYCKVCPVCDGRACAGEVPGMGGLGTGSSFQSNVQALADLKFRMKLIHEITDPDTSLELLGRELTMPVLAAPMGGVSFNMSEKDEVDEYTYLLSKLGACKEAGTIGCTPDGVPPFIIDSAVKVIGELDGEPIPFIKPWEEDDLFEKIDRCAEAGATIFGMDIDAAGLVTLRKMGKPVAPKGPRELKEIVERTPGKFILKGIMTVEDARKAVDAGVDAIVVSDHGGRVLDFTPGTAEVLPSIASAVGNDITVLADGGIRSGADVLKMLALGADAVMIGRPFAVATLGGLKDGAAQYLEQIRMELISSMILTGTQSVTDVSGSILRRS